MAVLPVRSMGLRVMPATMALETGSSPGVPKRMMSASRSERKRLAKSAKRSGGQHLAEP